jgi:hypothetical protein
MKWFVITCGMDESGSSCFSAIVLPEENTNKEMKNKKMKNKELKSLKNNSETIKSKQDIIFTVDIPQQNVIERLPSSSYSLVIGSVVGKTANAVKVKW